MVPEREITAIARAYDDQPNNPEFRFRHYFQNVIGTDQMAASRKIRPPGVDELTWRGLLDEVGGEHNADGLWPVPGDGFKTLAERARVQDAELASEREYLDAVDSRVAEMRRFRSSRLTERVAQVSRTQAEQQHRLLRLMRVVEKVEGKRFEAQHDGGVGRGGYDFYDGRRHVGGMNDEERVLASRLRRLQGALSRSATSLPRRVDALAAAHRAEKAADARGNQVHQSAAAAAALRAKRARDRSGVGGALGGPNGAAPNGDGKTGTEVVGGAFSEKPPLALALSNQNGPEKNGPPNSQNSNSNPAVDEATAAAYSRLVAEQADATRRLADILKKDLRDLAVLRRENAKSSLNKNTPQHVPYY